MPGRLHRWKRVDLVIDAYKHVKRDVPLLITGTGEDEKSLRAAAAGDGRGSGSSVTSSERPWLDLYADALLVPFVPMHEDLRTHHDRGIQERQAGPDLHRLRRDARIRARRPQRLRRRTQTPGRSRGESRTPLTTGALQRAWARTGLESVGHIAWEPIVEALTGARRSHAIARHEGERAPSGRKRLDVTVLDMQPIHPAVGGGRLRLLGLYHALGADLRATYVGTYDWPGEATAGIRSAPDLEEIDVPLTDAHFAAAAAWRERAGGSNVIDSAFPHLAHHSRRVRGRVAPQGGRSGHRRLFRIPGCTRSSRTCCARDRSSSSTTRTTSRACCAFGCSAARRSARRS